MSPIQAAQTLPFFSCQATDENLCLKKDHDHFYQVQGRLVTTHAKWCNFYVYTPNGFSSERITFDDSIWKSVVSKLDDYYFKYVVPSFLHATVPFTVDLIGQF